MLRKDGVYAISTVGGATGRARNATHPDNRRGNSTASLRALGLLLHPPRRREQARRVPRQPLRQDRCRYDVGGVHHASHDDSDHPSDARHDADDTAPQPEALSQRTLVRRKEHKATYAYHSLPSLRCTVILWHNLMKIACCARVKTLMNNGIAERVFCVKIPACW